MQYSYFSIKQRQLPWQKETGQLIIITDTGQLVPSRLRKVRGTTTGILPRGSCKLWKHRRASDGCQILNSIKKLTKGKQTRST